MGDPSPNGKEATCQFHAEEAGGEEPQTLGHLGELRYQGGSSGFEAPSVQWLLYLGLFTTQGRRVLEQKLGNELKLPHPILPQILSCFSEVSLL